MSKHQNSNRFIHIRTVLLITIVTLLIFAAASYGYYHSKVSKLAYDDGTIEQEGTISESEVLEDSAAMETATEGLEESEAILPTCEVFDDKDVFNILLIGTDERTKNFNTNARGDSCMLLSVNKKTMKISLVSFERGQGVPILSGSYQGQWDWLTHTFRYGGADLMLREIQECYKVNVKYYVRVNIYTFIQLVEAVGGVDIDLTEAEAEYLNTGAYAKAHLKEMPEDVLALPYTEVSPGINHLSGSMAMVYARCRIIDNDWKRVGRQRKVIQAAINRTKDLSLLEINSMLDTVLPLVQTNLTEKEINELVLLAPHFMGTQLQQTTMPESGTYGSMTGMGGRKMFAVDFEENSKRLQQMLYGEN